jgi:Ca2+-binding RTX toxin-like protein
LANGVENLTLTGTGNINGTGNASDNVITSNTGNNILTGGAGADRLDGGAGADTMIGGLGDDTYVVDNAGDVVIEAAGATYAPPAGFTIKGTADLDGDGETDVLLLNPTTNVTELQLIKAGVGQVPVLLPSWNGWPVQGFVDADGDGDKDVLYLSGRTQYAVYLNGTAKTGEGYVSNKITDTIGTLTGGNEGTDTVFSSISHTLANGVENLTLTGTGNINGTGNASNNVITGNTGNNTISGLGGNDTLTGGGGTDTFVFAANLGKDTVTDFRPGEDLIQIDHAVFGNLSDFLAHAVDDGHGNVVATANANDAITLQGTSVSALQQHQNDFLFV